MYEDIIKSNKKLITKIAAKYCYDSQDLDDWYQEACLQTINIYNKYYDKNKGVKFSTYLYKALPLVLNRIKYTRKMDSLVKVPDYIGQKFKYDREKYTVVLTDKYDFVDSLKSYTKTPDKILEDKVTFMNEINEYKFLSDTDKEVIRYYYGINLDRSYNQSEIAMLFNYKSCYVIHNKIKRALDKIRKHLGVETNGKKNKEN